MTNRLGCEVFFRKIADYDTEKEEYTHDVFKAVLDKLREDSLKLRGIEFLNQLWRNTWKVVSHWTKQLFLKFWFIK